MQKAQDVSELAPFIQMLGIKFDSIAPGRVTSHLAVQPFHLQHHGYVHAGVQATLADHSCGLCATTVLENAQTQAVLTADFHIHLLRTVPHAIMLQCEAQVIKKGKQLMVVEANVYTIGKESKERVHSARLVATLAVVNKRIESKM